MCVYFAAGEISERAKKKKKRYRPHLAHMEKVMPVHTPCSAIIRHIGLVWKPLEEKTQPVQHIPV